MADKMEFPKTMREFIDNHSFKDIEEVYTNGAELVPVFRVEQALEHYEKEIRNKAIDDLIAECENAKFAESDEISLSDVHTGVNSGLSMAIHFAEQLKVGGENGKERS